MAKIIINVDLNSASASANIKKLKADISGIGDPSGAKNIDSLRKSYANLINTIQGSEKNYKKGTFSKIAEEAKANLDALKKLDPATSDYAKKAKHLDDELKKLQADFAEAKISAKNFHGTLKDIVSGFMKFQLAAMLVMKPLQLVNQALDSINETLVETEKRIVAIRRVAGDAANSKELYDLAQRYGQTFENVADVVENFAKSGYTWEESLQAAEAAVMALNVAELDASQATEGLIAVMKQFGIEVSYLNNVVDLLNYTADNAAVTTEKLLIALQKTGSTAANAGLSLEDTVALITALSEGTAASGQNIGNALRSLFVFTSDKKALETFASLSEEMNSIVKSYQSGQGDILDVWQGLGNELNKLDNKKGMLSELFGSGDLTADMEGTLTQIEDSFAEIYGTAGNYRQNYFIALLNNIDEVNSAVKDMGDVAGYSAKENEKTLETYEAKANQLKEKWHELVTDEEGWLEFKKGLLSAGNVLLTVIEYTGGLETLLRNIATITSTIFIYLKGDKIAKFFKDSGNALKNSIISIKNYVISIKNAKQATDSASISVKGLGKAFQSAIPIIGFAITILQTLWGVIENIIQKNKEAEEAEVEAEIARKQRLHERYLSQIEAWNAIKKEAMALESIYEEYNRLTPQTDEYYNLEKQLVSLLGEKAEELKILTQGTEGYSNALKALAEIEIEEAKAKALAAQHAATMDLKRYDIPSLSNTDAVVDGRTSRLSNYFHELGLDSMPTKSVEDRLKLYDKLVQSRTVMNQKYKEALESGNIEDAEYIKGAISQLQNIIDEFEPYVSNYKNTTSNLDLINGNKSPTTSVSNISKDQFEGIINKMEDIRREQERTNEIAEKQLSIEEKELALEKAKTQRDVRVYNAETGQFEFHRNNEGVANAEDALKKEINNYNDYIFDSAMEELSGLESMSAKDIVTIYDKWAAQIKSGGDKSAEDYRQLIIDAFISQVGFDPFYEMAMTNILMQKAPSLINGMLGLLFGSSSDAMRSGGAVINNNSNGTTNNRNGGNDYYINGVQVGSAEATSMPMQAVFDNMILV